MQIIDAFRFPIQQQKENDLFDVNQYIFLDERNASYDIKNLWIGFDDIENYQSTLFNNKRSWALLLNPDSDFDLIKKYVSNQRVKAFVLHPYLQNIFIHQYEYYLEACKKVSNLGVPIIICTAFGSPKIYQIKPLEFSEYIASNISSKVVLSHCGGAKIIEAMLLAEAYSNIYLDTSFTLSYWKGSSVEIDIAFAIKKLDRSKFMFGSDAPFINQQLAINDCIEFLDGNNFSDDYIESILYLNAKHIYRL